MFEFAIRDDDVNYFTEPADIETAYAELDDAIPVSFAIVPFQGCNRSPAVPRERWNEDGLYPFKRNETLVRYFKNLLDDDAATVMLHGFSHLNADGEREFVGGSHLSEKIRLGRRHLEQALDTDVDIFVPPNNSLSPRGLSAVKGEGMNLFYYPSTPQRPVTPRSVIAAFRDLRFKYRRTSGGPLSFVRRLRNRDRNDVFLPTLPRTYRVGGQPEFSCESLTKECLRNDDVVENIKKQLRLADEADGKFCLAVHYHCFEHRRFKEQFYELIEYAQTELDPMFVTADQLFNDA